MSSLNKCLVIGNLGADPEMRFTANGEAVTNFSVAANDAWTDRSGARHDRVEWFSVVAWGKLAETCAQYLQKGRQVYVEGRLQTRSWDGQDGQKHYKTELVAQQVRFLGGRDERADERPADAADDDDPDSIPF